MLDDLAESVFDSGASPVGALRIAVPSTCSRLRLAPHLAAFLSDYPRVFLDVVVADHYSDLALDRIDVAIRIGLPNRDANLVVRTLVDNPRYVVASHPYFERSGMPQTPQALDAHECFRVAYGGGYEHARSGSSAAKPWRSESRFALKCVPSAVQQSRHPA